MENQRTSTKVCVYEDLLHMLFLFATKLPATVVLRTTLLQSVYLILRCRHSLVRLITEQNTVRLPCFCQNVCEIHQLLDVSHENNSAFNTIDDGLKVRKHIIVKSVGNHKGKIHVH